MEHLPDDALLEVLKRLPVEDLLRCRLVCHRFRGLALHPFVWRDKCVPFVADGSACPALRLAPCLGTLRLPFSWELFPCQLPYTTSCAARSLEVAVSRSSGGLNAAMVIRRQAALGCLRKLVVRVHSALADADARPFLEAVASTAGLEDVEISNDVFDQGHFPNVLNTSCSAERPSVYSSIKKFHCNFYWGLEKLLEFVVARHAATLEELCYLPASMASQVGRLAELPRLRELSCALLPSLEALLACKTLTSLTLEVEDEPEAAAVRGAGALLRGAGQLREVGLVHNEDASSVEVVGELLRALASPSQSSLQSLSISASSRLGGVTDEHLQPEPLLEALPRLPALRQLSLGWHSDEVLRGLGAATAPALRSLRLDALACANAWHRGASARALAAANPALHVRVANYCSGCDACGLDPGLRQALWGRLFVNLYSHPEGHCTEPDLHDDGVAGTIWIRIPHDEE